MSETFWKLSQNDAWLQTGSLGGLIDLSRPSSGLQKIVSPQWGESIFQVHRGLDLIDTEMPVREAYVRGTDLIATYGETTEHPYSTQIYWRALPATEFSYQAQAAIELVVSAQTHLLSAHPSITTLSKLRFSEILHLLSAQSGETIAVSDTDQQTWPVDLSPSDSTGCLIARFPDNGVSYVEMAHPSDFMGVELSRDTRGNAGCFKRPLICRWMEKGVIVRARLRSLYVNRADDVSTAIIAYQEFCESTAPLTV